MFIIKRDGTQVLFDYQKIVNAINKAFIEVDGELYENDTALDIALEIGRIVERSVTRMTVEDIQDLVETYLMKSERPDVAKAYIRFRYKKEVARKFEHDFIDAIGEKLQATNVQNQNANVDEHSFGGRMGEASGVMTKRYALDYLISPKFRDNHLNNRIYIHDLDHYALGDHNCLSIPFDKLLANGFNTRQTDVRPAGSVNTACQLIAVIFQLQSLQQFGGVSATHIDWTMVPYIRKSFWKHYKEGNEFKQGFTTDAHFQFNTKRLYEIPIDGKNIFDQELQDYYNILSKERDLMLYAKIMTEKEVHQAVEGLYHNLNTLQSRSGNQLN